MKIKHTDLDEIVYGNTIIRRRYSYGINSNILRLLIDNKNPKIKIIDMDEVPPAISDKLHWIMNEEKPEVGMGATLVVGSDRYPYTISRVSPSGKTLWMKADKYRRIDHNGLSESQEYEYAEDPLAPDECVRLTKRGWKSRKSSVVIGIKRAYQDPSF